MDTVARTAGKNTTISTLGCLIVFQYVVDSISFGENPEGFISEDE